MSELPATPALPAMLPGGRVCPILTAPDPRLLALSAPAGELRSAQLFQLAADLLVTMYHAGGRGLAAPQIGVLRRIFVMDAGWKQGRPAPVIILDPELRPHGDTLETMDEACLSIPGRIVPVTRPARIDLRYFDLLGRAIGAEMGGIEARIVQHETDHLNGILIGAEREAVA
ncbi:MAG: peptide deformylase [Paracoccus sp. (in: a-proteobacteria)]|nr:peptide deformylase [Paracoccus sp. (in: a-proteobacteria)]